MVQRLVDASRNESITGLSPWANQMIRWSWQSCYYGSHLFRLSWAGPGIKGTSISVYFGDALKQIAPYRSDWIILRRMSWTEGYYIDYHQKLQTDDVTFRNVRNQTTLESPVARTKSDQLLDPLFLKQQILTRGRIIFDVCSTWYSEERVYLVFSLRFFAFGKD